MIAHPHEREWYSIVICNLKNLVTIPAIQVKTYIEEESGEFKKNDKGTYFTSYATEKDYVNDIALKPAATFCTPLEIYNSLSREQREVTDAIKFLCNSYPTAYIWHNGQADDGCKFHGLHVHLIQSCSQKISGDFVMRQAKQRLQRHDVEVKTQRINQVDALTRHLLTKPRFLLGVNNMDLCARIVRLRPTVRNEEYTEVDFEKDDDAEAAKEMINATMGITNYLCKTLNVKPNEPTKDPVVAPQAKSYILRKAEEDSQRPCTSTQAQQYETEPDKILNGPPKRLPTSKTASKVEIVKNMIRKHNQRSVQDLLMAIMKSGDKAELEEFRTLRLGPTFTQIFIQATTELDMEHKLMGRTFVDTFIEESIVKEDSLSMTQTAITLVNWCREQSINPGDFLLKLFCTLDQTFPKINCFMMQGRSNAGKTYWLNPIVSALPDIVGQTLQSADFASINN